MERHSETRLESFVEYGKPERHHARFSFGCSADCILHLMVLQAETSDTVCSLGLSKFSIDDLLPMVVLTLGSVVIITVVPIVIPIQVT